MNKIISELTKDAKGVKLQRATILAEEMQTEQDEIIREITVRNGALEMKLLNLSDLSPEDTYSLRPGGEAFNAKNWARETQNTKVELLNVQAELKLAEETNAEWFVDGD